MKKVWPEGVTTRSTWNTEDFRNYMNMKILGIKSTFDWHTLLIMEISKLNEDPQSLEMEERDLIISFLTLETEGSELKSTVSQKANCSSSRHLILSHT